LCFYLLSLLCFLYDYVSQKYNSFIIYLKFQSCEVNNNGDANSKCRKIKIKDNIIPKSAEPSFSKNRRSRELRKSAAGDERRVHSGPKERTPVFHGAEYDDLQRSNSYSDLSTIPSEENVAKKKSAENTESSADQYYKTNIEPLVKQMQLNHLHEDTASLIVNFDMLWKTLEIGNMFGKSSVLARNCRTELLQVVYKCINHDSPLLLLKLSKLFLSVSINIYVF